MLKTGAVVHNFILIVSCLLVILFVLLLKLSWLIHIYSLMQIAQVGYI